MSSESADLYKRSNSNTFIGTLTKSLTLNKIGDRSSQSDKSIDKSNANPSSPVQEEIDIEVIDRVLRYNCSYPSTIHSVYTYNSYNSYNSYNKETVGSSTYCNKLAPLHRAKILELTESTAHDLALAPLLYNMALYFVASSTPICGILTLLQIILIAHTSEAKKYLSDSDIQIQLDVELENKLIAIGCSDNVSEEKEEMNSDNNLSMPLSFTDKYYRSNAQVNDGTNNIKNKVMTMGLNGSTNVNDIAKTDISSNEVDNEIDYKYKQILKHSYDITLNDTYCNDNSNNNTLNIIGNDRIKMNNIFDSDNQYKYWSVDPTTPITPSTVNVNGNKYDTFLIYAMIIIIWIWLECLTICRGNCLILVVAVIILLPIVNIIICEYNRLIIIIKCYWNQST